MKKFLSIFILALVVLSGFAGDRLVILHTNDTHSQIEPDLDNKGGVLRRKVLIDSVRHNNDNVLLIDAGDAVQGTLYFNLFGGAVETTMLDSLKYDMIILGNHEFDNGIDSISTFYKRIKAEKLSANYDFSKSKLAGLFKPYTIKEFRGKKIAFIGINLNPQGMIAKGNYNGLVYSSPYDVADSLATVLKNSNQADYVVAITHIGYTSASDSIPNDVALIKKSHNIDLLIGGHSHTRIDPESSKSVAHLIKNADGREILVTQAYKSGKFVGEIDVDLNTLTAKSKLLPVTSAYDAKVDKKLESVIASFKHPVDSLMNNVIANSEMEMATEWGKNARIMNWMSDEALKIARTLCKEKIDLAIMNKGGIRRPMPKGDVTEGLISSMFPFDGGLVVLKIKGSDLIDAFKVMSTRGGDALSAGMKVVYGKNGVIHEATLNGKKINPKKDYTIVTLQYLANGGDYMTPLTKATRIMSDSLKFGDRILKTLKSGNQTITSTDETRMYIK